MRKSIEVGGLRQFTGLALRATRVPCRFLCVAARSLLAEIVFNLLHSDRLATK